MGFWSKLGKGLLKVAPIAASFIPGVGPLAAMGIGAATGAASGAFGGGKKGALLGGITGGLAGYGGAKGIGPSKSFIGNDVARSGNIFGSAGNGWQSKLGSIISDSPWEGGITGNIPRPNGSRPGIDFGGITGQIGSIFGNRGAGGNGIGPSAVPSYGMEQQNPNLAYALSSGRDAALADQPWRTPAPPIFGSVTPKKKNQLFTAEY